MTFSQENSYFMRSSLKVSVTFQGTSRFLNGSSSLIWESSKLLARTLKYKRFIKSKIFMLDELRHEMTCCWSLCTKSSEGWGKRITFYVTWDLTINLNIFYKIWFRRKGVKLKQMQSSLTLFWYWYRLYFLFAKPEPRLFTTIWRVPRCSWIVQLMSLWQW